MGNEPCVQCVYASNRVCVCVGSVCNCVCVYGVVCVWQRGKVWSSGYVACSSSAGRRVRGGIRCVAQVRACSGAAAACSSSAQ